MTPVIQSRTTRSMVATTEVEKVVGGAVIGEDQELIFAHDGTEVPVSIQMEMLDKLVWSSGKA